MQMQMLMLTLCASPFSSLLVPQYTIGLGQEFMAYSSDVEDINSYALTGGSALA